MPPPPFTAARDFQRWLIFGPDPSQRLHPAQLAGAVEQALALTVQKAQTSEAEEVIVLVPPRRTARYALALHGVDPGSPTGSVGDGQGNRSDLKRLPHRRPGPHAGRTAEMRAARRVHRGGDNAGVLHHYGEASPYCPQATMNSEIGMPSWYWTLFSGIAPDTMLVSMYSLRCPWGCSVEIKSFIADKINL